MKKIIDIYYFSGTGNTFLAAETFANHISVEGFSVNLFRLEKSRAKEIDTNHIIGVAFPVAMSTYPLVWDFVYALPKTAGTKIFMLATMAGGSIGLVGKMKSVLSEKGYIPIGAHQAKMPPNVFYVLDEERNKKIQKEGLASVKIYAEEIANGTAGWQRIPFLSEFAYCLYLAIIGLWKFQWHQRFFRYTVDESRCTHCGFCAQLCPVENIELNSIPRFGLKCQYCMRCISYCPAKAIRSKFQYKNRTYMAASLPYKKVIQDETPK
jgi:ferredoxin/flavodoxin